MAELIDRRILRHLKSADSILDVGCGEGRLATFLASHTRKRVVGLDISSWVVGEGEERGICFRFTAVEIERFLAKAGFQNINVEWVESYFVLVIGEKNENSASEEEKSGERGDT